MIASEQDILLKYKYADVLGSEEKNELNHQAKKLR